MHNSPKVSVVILNYNGRHWLEKFLPVTIQRTTYENAEIVVADNASTDDSISFLKTNFPSIRIIQNALNSGYAGGYNEALRLIKSDYYVLLNSDVEVTDQWIEHVIVFMQNENMAACQPKILSYSEREKFEYAGAAGGFIDKYGYPFCRGRIFETCEKDHGQYDISGEIFWASGACMFIRAQVFHLAGGFDDDFFAHMEEIDLCWRLKNLGYKIGYCAKSIVYHVGGGTLNKSHPRKTYLNFKNNRALLHKNLSKQKLKEITLRRDLLDRIALYKSRLTNAKSESDAIKKALEDHKADFDMLNDKRKKIETDTILLSVGAAGTTGIYNGSIVWQYFVKRVRKFSDLHFKNK